jgi:thiol peroxidase
LATTVDHLFVRICLTAGILVLSGCGGGGLLNADGSLQRTGPGSAVSWGGRPISIEGDELRVGSPAPEATLYTTDRYAVKLSSFRGKVMLISVVPELGTPICDRTTRQLERAARSLSGDVAALTVSADPVWHQALWCEKNGIRRVRLLSDDKRASFGRAFGLVVSGRKTLARAILVIDSAGTLRHIQVMRDIAEPPDLGSALAAAAALAGERRPTVAASQ